MSDPQYSSNDIGNPNFRTVPERWIIMRTIQAFLAGPFARRVMVRSGESEVDCPASLFNSVPGDSGSIRSIFVVQSVSVLSMQQVSTNVICFRHF